MALGLCVPRSRMCAVLAVLGLFLSVSANTASASLVAKDIVRFTRTGNYGGAYGGGAFTMWKYNAQSNSYDKLGETFCLELDEGVQTGVDFKVGGISTKAVLGGRNTNQGDDLDFATDLLYKRYTEGTLDQVDLGGGTYFSYDSNRWNNAFQAAVWEIEDERDDDDFSDDWRYKYKAKKLRDWAVSQTQNETKYSGLVWALNLFDISASDADIDAFDPYDQSTWGHLVNKHKQDQLWYQQDGNSGSAVPEPGTMATWFGLAAFGLVLGRARRKLMLRKSN